MRTLIVLSVSLLAILLFLFVQIHKVGTKIRLKSQASLQAQLLDEDHH